MTFLKKNKDLICFFIFFVFSLIICWNFLGYASFDHYKIYDLGYVEYAKQIFFTDGRIFSGLYLLLANLLNISIGNLQAISTILSLLLFSISSFYLRNIFLNAKENANKTILLVLSYLTLFNFMCANILMFVESPIIVASILLYIISAKFLIIDNKKLKSMLVLLIAMFCYQGTFNVFFAISLFLYLLNNKIEIKNFVKKSAICIIFVVISVAFNYLFISVYSSLMNYSSSRIALSISSILNSLPINLNLLKDVLTNSARLFPKYMYLILLLVLTFVFSYISYKYKNNSLLKFLLIAICNILVCVPLVIIFHVSEIYICGRLFWSIGSTLGMSLIMLYFHIIDNNVNFEKKVFILLTLVCIILSYLGMYIGIIKYKNGNIIDKEFCNELENQISQYPNVDTLILHYDYVANGLTEYYSNSSYRSYLLAISPLEFLLNYYTDINVDIEYSLERKSESNSDSYIVYTVEGNYLYVDINI